MAGDSTGKVTSGSPFRAPPATIWNNMVDAGQAHAAGQFSSESPGATRSRATDLLKLKNSSGAVRAQGEILKIEGKVLETVTAESIWLNGIEPTTDCRFGILKYPADENEVVTAQVSGVCMATVNVTDAAHTFASAFDEEYLLQSGGSGPLEILYAPTGTGELECVVRFGADGPRPFIIVEADGVTDNASYHRWNTTGGGKVVIGPWDGAGVRKLIRFDLFQGATFTGCVVMCQSIAGTLYAVSGGQGSPHFTSVVADADILPGESGEVTISYIDADGGGRAATVVARNDLDMTVEDGDSIHLKIDSTWWDEEAAFSICLKVCP